MVPSNYRPGDVLCAHPRELIHIISSACGPQDVLTLSRVSHEVRRSFTTEQPTVQALFGHHYLTLARQDPRAPLPLQGTLRCLRAVSQLDQSLGVDQLARTLALRIKERWSLGSQQQARDALNRRLTQESPHLLSFDARNTPVVTPLSDIRRNLSFFQRYAFYRGSYHHAGHEQARQLCEKLNQLSELLHNQPLSRTYPLQDARNRDRQIELILEDRSKIDRALQSSVAILQRFKETLPFWEKVAFKLASWVHSYFSPAFNPATFSANWPQPADRGIGRVRLADSEVTFEGKVIPVAITVDARMQHGNHLISIYQRNEEDNSIDTETLLGYTLCEKFWRRREDTGHFLNEDSLRLQITGPNLLPDSYRLNFANGSLYLGYDRQTGDLPLDRLITQVAVEIFQRDPKAECLTLFSHGRQNAVCAASGFESSSIDFYRGLPQLKQEIVAARQSGKLFPDDKVLRRKGAWSATLTKERLDLPLVDFALNQAPISWNEQIERQPILSGENPVLPEFLNHDPVFTLQNAQAENLDQE